MKSETVICYGASSGFELLYYGINAIYNVIGVSDKDSEKSTVADKYGIRYIRPEQLAGEEFDYIVITSCYENAIRKYLIEEIGVSESKIIGYTEFLSEQKCSLGQKNSDKDIYILRRMDTCNGINVLLLEYLYRLIHCDDLERYNVVIDAQNYPGIYHNDENKGKQNIIEYYFDSINDISIEDAYQSKNVVLSGAAMLNENLEKITRLQWDICKDEAIRKQYQKLYKEYFPLNEEMKSYIAEQKERYILPLHKQGRKICAVVDRTLGYNDTKTWGHYEQPEIDFSFAKLEELREKWKFDYILLDTHIEDTERKYREHFGDMIICTERTRVNLDEVHRLNIKKVSQDRMNDEFLQGKELLASRYLLAGCDFFYSGISGSSTFPMLIGENFIDTYIYENGRFGFEKEADWGLPVKG